SWRDSLLVGAAHGSDGIHDLLVAGAAAKIAFDAAFDRLGIGMRMGGEQMTRLHHHAGRAVAALDRTVLDECGAQRIGLGVGSESFYGRHYPAAAVDREQKAGVERQAVDRDGAGGALAFAAAIFGAG